MNLAFSLDPGTGQVKRMSPDLPPLHVRSDAERQLALEVAMQGSGGTRMTSTFNLGMLVDALWTGPVTDVKISG